MAVGSKWWMSSMSDDKISFDEGGFSFNVGGLSSGKIAIIFAAVSTIVGGLWAGFEVYQQFLTMKEVTATYAAMGDDFNKMTGSSCATTACTCCSWPASAGAAPR